MNTTRVTTVLGTFRPIPHRPVRIEDATKIICGERCSVFYAVVADEGGVEHRIAVSFAEADWWGARVPIVNVGVVEVL